VGSSPISQTKILNYMTKKYWLDWQKRIGETRNIELFSVFSHGEYKMKLGNVLNELAEEKLIKATFHKNTVDLIIERHKPKLKDEYKNHIRDIVRQTWFEEIYDDVSKVKEQILQDYKTSLQMACSKYIQQVENATNNIDERIEKAVAKYFKERLGK